MLDRSALTGLGTGFPGSGLESSGDSFDRDRGGAHAGDLVTLGHSISSGVTMIKVTAVSPLPHPANTINNPALWIGVALLFSITTDYSAHRGQIARRAAGTAVLATDGLQRGRLG